jgi:hypothetical protein
MSSCITIRTDSRIKSTASPVRNASSNSDMAHWDKAGLPGEREEPADALFGVRAGEGVPDRRRERAGSAEAGRRVGVAVHALPDGDAPVAGCHGTVGSYEARAEADCYQ